MILVTGASGLLGSSLAALAHEQGREVCGLFHRHAIPSFGVPAYSVDLTDEAATNKILAEINPSAIIHCAAATSLEWCENHPEEAESINVAASRRIAAVTSQANIRLLHISTDSVFDGIRGGYCEGDQPAPVNVYARTKLGGEREVLECNPQAAIARVTLYGWSVQDKNSLAEWILQELALEHKVPGFTDVIFCPLLANDLAGILLAMVDRNLQGIYHVTGAEPIDKYQFARRVALMFGFDPGQVVPARLADAKLKAQRPRNTSLNTKKICAALGRTMPDVDSGLQKFAQLREDGYLQRFRDHYAGARK